MIDLAKELSEHFKVTDHQVELSLPKSLSYFQGHFPQVQVLPAVGIVDISLFFIERIFGPSSLKRIPRVKMKRPIESDQPLLLQCQINDPADSEGEFTVTWKDRKDDSVIVELTLVALDS